MSDENLKDILLRIKDKYKKAPIDIKIKIGKILSGDININRYE